MKFLFWILVIGAAAWWWHRHKRSAIPKATPQWTPRSGEGIREEMLVCSHCQVHFPKSEVVLDGESPYCSEAHRRLHRSATPDHE